MRRLYTFILASFFVLVLTTASTANAHVLIRDDSGSTGAILHISPDDDPIGGEPSVISFSIDGTSLESDKTSLTITNTTTKREDMVTFDQNDAALRASYTFPSQGVYTLSLTTTKNKGQKVSFTYTQRVSRGISGEGFSKSSYPLARFGLAVTIVALVVLITIAIGRRQDILNQSMLK